MNVTRKKSPTMTTGLKGRSPKLNSARRTVKPDNIPIKTLTLLRLDLGHFFNWVFSMTFLGLRIRLEKYGFLGDGKRNYPPTNNGYRWAKVNEEKTKQRSMKT